MTKKKDKRSRGRPISTQHVHPPEVPPQPSPPASLQTVDGSIPEINDSSRHSRSTLSHHPLLHLDGSTLEGGGQLVRVALCLSALLSIPIHITRIRGNRANRSRSGGLKESHLAALNFLARYSCAKVEGAEVGSGEITFSPGARRSPEPKQLPLKATIQLTKPGSVFLILQAVLPFILYSSIFGQQRRAQGPVSDGVQGSSVFKETRVLTLHLHGGTHVSQAMSGEYVQQVLLPSLEQIGCPHVEIEVVKRGWAGSASEIGEVIARIPIPELSSTKTHPMEARAPPGPSLLVSRNPSAHPAPSLQKINVTIMASPPRQITLFTMQQHLYTKLHESFPHTARLDLEPVKVSDSQDPRRLYILLVAHFCHDSQNTDTRRNTYPVLSADYLAPGRSPRNMVEYQRIWDVAVENVVGELRHKVDRVMTSISIGDGSIDRHLEDQLVIFEFLDHYYSSVAGAGDESSHTNRKRGTDVSSDEAATENANDEDTNPNSKSKGEEDTNNLRHDQHRDTQNDTTTNTVLIDNTSAENQADTKPEWKAMNHPLRSGPGSIATPKIVPKTLEPTLHTQTARWVCEQFTRYQEELSTKPS